eukprot:ctg_3319.g617
MAPRKDEKEPRKYEALFEKRPRNYGIGQSIQPKRDLSRYVRWPKYVRLQRQRKVLLQPRLESASDAVQVPAGGQAAEAAAVDAAGGGRGGRRRHCRPRHPEAALHQARRESRHRADRAEAGQAGAHRARCRPDRVGAVDAGAVPQDGRAVRYHPGQGAAGPAGAPKDRHLCGRHPGGRQRPRRFHQIAGGVSGPL